MKCPRCRNKNFEPTPDVKSPLKNMGNKEHFDTFDTRRYVCLQCGYSWMTKETFYRDINIKNNNVDAAKQPPRSRL
jgi:predicted nucleic-acid-binding Zn-ribbon protein